MIHYRISSLDSNKTILEQLEDIKKYLTENPQYQVFYYNGNYVNTTNTYEVTNLVLNARTINKGDIVLFANSYYAVVDAIGNNNFVVEHAIEMNSQAILDLRNFVISNYQTKLTFDNIPKSGSNNPVTSDGIYVAMQLDKQDVSDAIQELTESIANNYQTKLSFDTTPTLGSNNPVTSDGIKKAITETIQTEHQVPSGGTAGQALKKSSNADYDYNWEDVKEVPTGGTTGQILTKNANGYEWSNIPKDNDYIVEQGTSNGWIYRKWNSGIAECFRYIEGAVTGTLSAWGSLYNSDNLFGGFTYPFPFIKEPYCNIEASSTTGGGWFHYDETGTANVTPKWKWIRPTKLDNITINYRLYAIGQWK